MRWQRRNDQSYYERMLQISTEGVQGETRLGRQSGPLGKVQEISIWPYKQMKKKIKEDKADGSTNCN